MKCYNHPTEDALAVCRICGKGVCNNCLITIAGNSYCKLCVESGRVKVQAVGVPKPTGPPSRAPFIVGGIGAILTGFGALFTMVIGGLLFTLIFGVYYYSGYYYGLMGIGGIIFSIILATGLILAGIGYLGLRRNYGAGTGVAGFAFSIVVCVFIFVSVVFNIIALSYYTPYPWYPNPYYIIYVMLALSTILLFGVTQILWGAAHIRTRGYTGNSGLAMAAGIMMIISGALTMSIIVTFAGIILFFISEILATILFLMSRIPQQGL